MASSQEDVDVFDSWEDMDETEVLDRKLKEILPRAVKSIDTNSNKSPVSVILLGDDALRTQYVPPEPTVKILKRPTKDAQVLNGDCKPRQQFKTLKQREQEYAEARLRILGEAHCFDKDDRERDRDRDRISGIHQNKSSSTTSRSNSPPPPAPTTSSSSSSSRDAVIRMPRGPDGSQGFSVRR